MTAHVVAQTSLKQLKRIWSLNCNENKSVCLQVKQILNWIAGKACGCRVCQILRCSDNFPSPAIEIKFLFVVTSRIHREARRLLVLHCTMVASKLS